MARRLRDSGQSPLRDKLEALPRLWGLRRRDLAVQLGSGLRRLWDIEIDDSYEAVYDKVVSALEEVLLRLPSTRDQVIARLTFNIEPEEVRQMGTLEERRRWLNNLQVKAMDKSSVDLGAISHSTQRRRLDELIYPLLEQTLLAAWDRRFPGEPFPDDPPAGIPDDPPPLTASAGPQPDARKSVKPLWRRRSLRLGALVAVVLAVTIIIFVTRTGKSPGVITPESLLRATVLSTGTESAYGGIFPAELNAKASSYADKLSNSPNDTDYEKVFQDELDDGAYAAGGVRVSIALEVLVDGEISLYDIKPVNVKREQLPLDTVILMSLGHGPIANIEVSLDQAVPVAMEQGPGQPKRFGTDELMGLSKSQKGSIEAAFTAQTVAETFDIAITYEYQGTSYTQVLHRTPDGKPFRVAALMCEKNLQEPGPEVSTAQLEQLKTVRYRQVIGLDSTPNSAGGLSPKTIDPNVFAARCY